TNASCGSTIYNMIYQITNDTCGNCANSSLTLNVTIPDGIICNATGGVCNSEACIAGSCVTTITAINKTLTLTNFTAQSIDLTTGNIGISNCSLVNPGIFPGSLNITGCNVTAMATNCTTGTYVIYYVV